MRVRARSRARAKPTVCKGPATVPRLGLRSISELTLTLTLTLALALTLTPNQDLPRLLAAVGE